MSNQTVVPAELLHEALPATASSVTWFVPGRIEVLGKHTDYAGGRSLLAASSRGITFTAKANGSNVVRVSSDAVKDTVELPLSAQIDDYEGGHWAGYAKAVVTRLVKNFGDQVVGADINLSSDLPLASGMSSSSAVVVGVARCLMDLSGIESSDLYRRNISTPEELAAYLACIENGMSYKELVGHRGVGTFGGSEDHTAMLCGVEDSLVQYAFCPVRREAVVPFPLDYSFVVAVSGVLAEKSGAAKDAYNRASQSTREILAIWNKYSGRDDKCLADAIASESTADDQIRVLLGEDTYLRHRLEQFLIESNQIVGEAANALLEGNLVDFGELVKLSQHWTEWGLDNQVPQTVALTALARDLGALAASAFGAGFGGSVWALVPTAEADRFAQAWLSAYTAKFPEEAEQAQTLVTRPGTRARRLELVLN